jgi:hypothetical protein
MGKLRTIAMRRNSACFPAGEKEFWSEEYLTLGEAIGFLGSYNPSTVTRMLVDSILNNQQLAISGMLRIIFNSAEPNESLIEQINGDLESFAKVPEKIERQVCRATNKYILHIVSDMQSSRDMIFRYLRQTLLADMMFAYLLRNDGVIWRIPAHFWRGDSAIFAFELGRIDDPTTSLVGRVFIYRSDFEDSLNGREIQPRFDLPILPGDALAVNGSGYALPAPPNSEIIPKSRPGRRPEYDGEAFLTEATRILYYEGRPETQAELRRRTCARYVAAGHKGGEPGEDWAKRRISKLWNSLDLGEDR